MKKLFSIAIVSLLLVSCTDKSVKLEVSNTSSMDRKGEVICVDWTAVSQQLALPAGQSFIILDETGAQVPYQLITNGNTTPQELIFQATVNAGQKAIYSVQKGAPDAFPQLTYGRQVPERKDDFAWENDRAAYRMYGPALAPEFPSNGVDLWLKKTNDLIVNKFYKDDLENNISYHIDHGLGLDCYKVGHTLGAGGIVPYADNKLWIGGPYTTAQVLDCGPLRTTFKLTYDSVSVGNKIHTQTITISLDAGSQLNKAVVTYDGDFDTMELAGGIWLHDEIGNIRSKPESSYVAYGENASDSKVPAGRTYIGVFFPNGMKTALQQDEHLFGLADYKKGEAFTYYFGGGWSDWGFAADEDWFSYMDTFVAKMKEPLTVNILQEK